MTQKEFNSLTFSQRHEISKGTKCNASWQVRTIGGSAAYAISCRECGTVLQSDCTPKCLLLHPPLTDVNPHVMQAEGSDGMSGATVGQRNVDTATCGVDDNGWNCKKTTEPGGVASQCMNGCVLAGSSCEG